MYRETPSDPIDSGWRFFSSEEMQEYADEPGNFAICAVNTIANYDPSIIPHFDAPIGSAFGRTRTGNCCPRRCHVIQVPDILLELTRER